MRSKHLSAMDWRTDMPAAQVIMITVYDDSDSIFESLAAGASGYL
jgi:DNA-binding NarL/FixJ family response regulator